MIAKILLILMLPLLLSASKILSYNIYDRTDRADVMITFDTPYEGKIKQSIASSKIIIKLEGASIESTKTKILASKFLQSINIVPATKHTKIIAVVPTFVKLKASKTSDSYGLRLRFSDAREQIISPKKITPIISLNQLPSLPTKKEDNLSKNYYIVIGILILGIVILFVLKNKIQTATAKNGSNSWLFKVANDAKSPSMEGVTIRFQKNINENNSVVMLDFIGQSYLVLMGSHNILLDKFTDNKPATQDDFDTILQNRHQELDDFLKEGDTQEKDPLQLYTEKAANISYTT